MNATDFNRLFGNNVQAAMLAISKKEIGFETIIGVIETQKQTLYDWRALCMADAAQKAQPLIQPSSTLPPNPPERK